MFFKRCHCIVHGIVVIPQTKQTLYQHCMVMFHGGVAMCLWFSENMASFEVEAIARGKALAGKVTLTVQYNPIGECAVYLSYFCSCGVWLQM